MRAAARQARDLLRAVLALNEGAVTRFCRVWGEDVEAGLQRCQHVVAKELGFESWAQLLASELEDGGGVVQR